MFKMAVFIEKANITHFYTKENRIFSTTLHLSQFHNALLLIIFHVCFVEVANIADQRKITRSKAPSCFSSLIPLIRH